MRFVFDPTALDEYLSRTNRESYTAKTSIAYHAGTFAAYIEGYPIR